MSTTGATDIDHKVRTACDWLIRQALPLWSGVGFDEQHGRFFERLDLAGRPIEAAPHRLMLQGRQIYAFSHAALLGWFPAGRARAERAVESMIRDFHEADGQPGFVFSIHRDGRIASAIRDTYGHAFALLGLAWAYRLIGDKRFLDIADRTIAFLDRSLAAPDGAGYLDALPAPDTTRRQNPHMHLFEAYLALDMAAPGRGYLERARRIYELFMRRFFQSRTGILAEYFDSRWQPLPGERGRIFEPGHHFEWIWLLRHYGRASGVDVVHHVDSLDRTALRWGAASDGAIYDEVLDNGTVHKTSRRLWPLTEATKAAAVQHEAGRAGGADRAATMLGVMLDRYLGRPIPGGWLDHFDAGQRPIVDFIPASSLYHVFLAVAEAQRVWPGA